MARQNYEKEAIEFVKLYEKQKGNRTWKPKKGIGCDLISSGGFYIEVKSWNKSALPNSIEVYESIFDHLKTVKKGDKAYYIYLVYDFENGPKLIRITPSNQRWYKRKIRILKKSSYEDIKPVDLSRYKKKIID